jgi:hypothetical protein
VRKSISDSVVAFDAQDGSLTTAKQSFIELDKRLQGAEHQFGITTEKALGFSDVAGIKLPGSIEKLLPLMSRFRTEFFNTSDATDTVTKALDDYTVALAKVKAPPEDLGKTAEGVEKQFREILDRMHARIQDAIGLGKTESEAYNEQLKSNAQALTTVDKAAQAAFGKDYVERIRAIGEAMGFPLGEVIRSAEKFKELEKNTRGYSDSNIEGARTVKQYAAGLAQLQKELEQYKNQQVESLQQTRTAREEEAYAQLMAGDARSKLSPGQVAEIERIHKLRVETTGLIDAQIEKIKNDKLASDATDAINRKAEDYALRLEKLQGSTREVTSAQLEQMKQSDTYRQILEEVGKLHLVNATAEEVATSATILFNKELNDLKNSGKASAESIELLRHNVEAFANQTASDDIKKQIAAVTEVTTRAEEQLNRFNASLGRTVDDKVVGRIRSLVQEFSKITGVDVSTEQFTEIVTAIQRLQAATTPDDTAFLKNYLGTLVDEMLKVPKELVTPEEIARWNEFVKTFGPKLKGSLIGVVEAATPATEAMKRLDDQIRALNEEDAVAKATAFKRYEVAGKEAHEDVARASRAAVESQIKDAVYLQDQLVFHADVARATILDKFARDKSITQIFSEGFLNATDAVANTLVGALDRITAKLGVFGDVIKNILLDLTRLAVDRIFRRLLDTLLPEDSNTTNAIRIGGGANVTGGGGSVAGTALNTFLPILTGGFAGGGGAGSLLGVGGGATQGFGMSPAIWSMIMQQAAGGGGLSAPSPNGGGLDTAALEGILPELGGSRSGGGARGVLGSLGSGLGLQSLANFAPFLGAGLGAGLGGRSVGGQILGAAGGLVTGIGADALISLLFSTNISGVTGTAAGLLGGLGLGATAATAALFGIGGALALGAYLLNRNSQRRKNEEDRTALSSSVYDNVIKILNATRSGSMDESAALAAWNKLKSDYFSHISSYDSKTKRIAGDWWNNDLEPYYLPLIKQAAKDAATAKEFQSAFVPTFGKGGDWVSNVPTAANGLLQIPGTFDARDDVLMRVSRGEHVAVMTPRQYSAIGGRDTFAAAGVPAAAGGLDMAPSSGSSSAGSGTPIHATYQRISIDAKGLVIEGLRSVDGRAIVIDTMRSHVEQTGTDGFLGDVQRKLQGGR